MATTTVSGSTVTFSNSGAAANLSAQTSEDSLLAKFDISTILAESGGGTKTTFTRSIMAWPATTIRS